MARHRLRSMRVCLRLKHQRAHKVTSHGFDGRSVFLAAVRRIKCLGLVYSGPGTLWDGLRCGSTSCMSAAAAQDLFDRATSFKRVACACEIVCDQCALHGIEMWPTSTSARCPDLVVQEIKGSKACDGKLNTSY